MVPTEALHRPANATTPRRAAQPSVKRPLIYLFLTLYAAFSIGAFLWVVFQSLKTNAEFLGTLPWTPPQEWRWRNYVDAWERAQLGRYVGNSLLVSIASTAGGLFISTLAAYALARIRGVKLAGPIQQLFLVGLMLPTILTVVPLYFLWVDLRLVNTRLGIILIYAGLMQPFSIYYLTAYFKALPYDLEEAAAVDGATPLRAFLRIFIPLSIPGLVAVFVVNFLWAWNEFFYALIFLSRQEKFTIPMGLYNLQVAAEYSAQWVPLFAGMLISVLPVLVLYLLLSEQITRGLTAGALKG